MAFEELLAWTGGRPLWQQDALRRLAEHGELTEDDLAELRKMIEASEGLTADAPEAVPLAAAHLSEAASNSPRTVLASLGPVANVDRLEPAQPPMRFAINGVTLVYGPNASGKSGYCRITKQLCRSLSPRVLRGNVFDDAVSPPPEVGIAYRVGGDDDPKIALTWRGTDTPPAELARISVFDTAAAGVYVDKERKIEFLPYELDLLNKLGVTARTLDQAFKEREDVLAATANTPLPSGYADGTVAFNLIALLGPETPLDDLPTEKALRDAAAFSSEDQDELEALAKQLESDPQLLQRLLREGHDSLHAIRQEVAAIETAFGDAAIAALCVKQQNAAAKRAAADVAAQALFESQPIPAVGSDAWRQMLIYAREFAGEVFPDSAPPPIAMGGKCVLCQQDLDDAASARLKAFDTYLEGRAADEASVAENTFAEAVSAIGALTVKSGQEVRTFLAGYAALTTHRVENAAQICAYVEAANARLVAVRRILKAGSYDELAALDSLPDNPDRMIDEDLAALDNEVDEIVRIERDDTAAAARRNRYAELTDKKRLSEQIDVVVDRRNKLEERKRVAACGGQCRLTAITQQITRRRREILTPSLKAALDDELQALRLGHIPLGLADHGDLGESIVEVALSAQQRIANNSEVLSEGEQRGLALACFLAELNEIGTDHGIIVDDPVSSLDHTRMETVARRLAQEAAKGRQVIVFTHNILFHYMLRTEARRSGVACHEEWMSGLGNARFGIIDDAQKPWHVRAVTERLHDIDQAKAALAKSDYDPNDESFRDDVRVLYTRMRETWERVVEEILFNKVIQRFRPEVMTQSLRAACFDTEKDYPLIFEGMKRTSHFSGHDLADDLPGGLPSLDDIDRDFGELREFAGAARERRKGLEKTMGVYEEGVAPLLL